MATFSPGHCGTEFGGAAVTHIRSHTMTAVVSGPDVKYSSRRRERRGAFGELLAALTRTLDSRGDTSLMRGAFEESLRRGLPVRSIWLGERASRWGRQRGGNDCAEASD